MQQEQKEPAGGEQLTSGPASERNIVDSVVIIPTYNEKENVAAIIEAVFGLPREFDVLIIDDNSPDGTAAIVKDLRKKYAGRLHAVERAGKQGLGTAYIAGFKWARRGTMSSCLKWTPTSRTIPPIC